jgi:hypothetical protein
MGFTFFFTQKRIIFMRLLSFLLFIVLSFLSQAQVRPIDLVKQAKGQFQTVGSAPFTMANSARFTQVPEEAKNAVFLTPDKNIFKQIINGTAKAITFQIPAEGRSPFILELVEVKVTENQYVKTEPGFQSVSLNQGKHFRGIIQGDESSLVAVSVFEDEMMGFISAPSVKGNLVIGKLKDEETHILYEDEDIMQTLHFQCATDEEPQTYSPSELKGDVGAERTVRCTRLYIEVDYDIYTQKGSSLTAVNNFVTGIFNQVGALYANENLTTTLSEIVVWTQPSPYNGTTSIAMLNAFTAHRQGFNGDLAQLISYKASGGVAYLNGFCRTNPDFSMSFASIHSTYSNVPAYSWTVEVCAHEFGHLFGSQHTHACVWNGNNTAIDGCYTTEGGCPNPGIPSGGGTIMSYCHLTNAGINFANGFGVQPGNVMRNRVSTANCLGNCEGGGGQECEGSEVRLTILVDNYPHETTWNLKNSANVIIYSGGPYTGANTIKTEDFCLPDGCYTFTMLDSYGDGICCAYGQGYYHVKKGEVVLGSGGQFTFSHVQTFCVSNNQTPTCNDGIQNGQETGIDCGGPTCPACPSCNDGIQNGQETGIDCGGPTCPACPSCNDGIQNGQETGIDCGGPTCPACPSCNDGIQNGQETGIDCGGPTCPACPSCNDGIQNGQETGIDCGGPSCPACPSCNDGIQNGQETGIDCGGPTCPACPSCNDGIQNGQETGIDCGGPTCPACGGGQVIETNLGGYYFETGWDGWTRGGSYVARYSGSLSPEALFSIRIAGNHGDASSFSSPTYALQTLDSVKVQFSFRSNGVENGKSFSIRYFNGSQWITLRNYVCGVDFVNNVVSTVTIKVTNNLVQNGRFRFTAQGADSFDRIYIDAVIIRGYHWEGGVSCNDGIQNGLETGIDCGGPSCPSCPSCNDGIQNGSETGIDCGGPSCPACPTCNDGIQNGLETGIDCGGPSCPSCPSCNDGIQNGSETGIDCGGPSCPACSSCNDGIQNGQETGIDCGGPQCPPCNNGNGVLIGGYYFETGWQGWLDGGAHCFRYGGSFSPEGTYSLRMRNSGTTSSTTSPVLNLTNYPTVTLAFSFKASGMESGKSFVVQYYNGTTYSDVATFVSGTDFNNNTTYNVTLTLTGSFSANSRFRFINQGADNSDFTFIDAVVIHGFEGSSFVENPALIEISGNEGEEYIEEGLLIYPNPAQETLFYQLTDVPARLKIFDAKGQLILDRSVSDDQGKIDISHIPSGLFILIAETPHDVLNTKFIKD